MTLAIREKAASTALVIKFVKNVFPLVNSELDSWKNYAERHGCPELSDQALASIRDKKFHCQGGSIYSLYDEVSTPDFTRLVVALQTISDYLDNLCDRAGIADEQAFRQLHFAMTDALDPAEPMKDYYQYYPYKDDGGYLRCLVSACRNEVGKLPAYHLVKPEILKLASLYSDLQTYKHLDLAIREAKMIEWINKHIAAYPGITPWEFAAATGSTLGMFMLCAAASSPKLTADETSRLSNAYFPWISGLHILLDYFIDAAEDLENGDLNFVAYYSDEAEKLSRLSFFCKQALNQARSIPHPVFTTTVIYGLLAMYLSDPKTEHPNEKAIRKQLLKTGGSYAALLHKLCRLLRRRKIL